MLKKYFVQSKSYGLLDSETALEITTLCSFSYSAF
jgi:hypothetical protein